MNDNNKHPMHPLLKAKEQAADSFFTLCDYLHDLERQHQGANPLTCPLQEEDLMKLLDLALYYHERYNAALNLYLTHITKSLPPKKHRE